MPTVSTLSLVRETFLAIVSMSSDRFTIHELVEKINENRRRGQRNRSKKAIEVKPRSVRRVLSELWLIFRVRKVGRGNWERGIGPIRGVTNLRPDILERIVQQVGVNITITEFDHWISLGEEPTTRKAYICYPYRGNPLRHSLELLVLLVYLYPIVKEDFVPATPHEMLWGLEEKHTRAYAMNECHELLTRCNRLLCCLKRGVPPSGGMKEDIRVAKENNIDIAYIEDLLGFYPDVTKVMKNCGLEEFTKAIGRSGVLSETVFSLPQKEEGSAKKLEQVSVKQ